MPRIILLLLLLFLTRSTHAQRLPFFNLSIESGLVQSQATSLAQDKWGRLWIGTLGGLSCYDGTTFTTYSSRDGLPSGTVMALAAHPDGAVWVGTSRGLARVNSGRIAPVRFPENPDGPAAVTRVAVGGDGRVWCLADAKLFAVAGLKAKAIKTGARLTTALGVTRSGMVLFGSGADGIFRIEKGEVPRRIASAPAGQSSLIMQRIFEDASGALYATTNHGLFGLQQGALMPAVRSGKPVPALSFTSAAQTRDGTLWLGTRSGVLRVTDTSAQLVRRRSGLTDNLVYDALTDREGHLWLASDGQGLFRFSGAPFEMLDESAGLPSAQVMAIATDARGTLYFGTYDAGLFSYTAGRVSAVPFPGGEVSSITALAYAPDGILWIGTRGAGLWTLKGGALRQPRITGGPPPQGAIGTLYIHPRTGELYTGLQGKGAVLRDGRFQFLPTEGAVVQDFLALGGDSLLLATVEGLKLAHSGTVAPFLTGGPADSAVPQCIIRRGSELWIGTADRGVLCYDIRTRNTLAADRSCGLRSDFVYNLVVDRAGAVWAGTGNGIHRIRLRHTTLQAARKGTDGKTVRGTLRSVEPVVRYFGAAYGVTGRESNQKAALMMPDGSLWFGTTAGAVHYIPGKNEQGKVEMVSRRPVSLSVIAVGAGGADTVRSRWFTKRTGPYNIPQDLRLPYRENSLTVRFRAVSLGGPQAMLYRYRLDGGAAEWSAWTPEERVTFSAVPTGKHRLLVECGTDGQTALQRTAFGFSVETPFHKTPLFYALIGAGCIGIGVGVQYLAARRQHAREAALEAARKDEQAKVRQRTAEDFHDEVGNTITRMTVLTSVLQSKVKEPEAVRIIEQIRENAGRLYSGTRDILWSLKPGADNLWEILHRIRDFGQDLFGDTDVRFVFSGSDERWREHRLSLDWSRNLTMIFKEALNNALKYAGATRVELEAALGADDVLTIRLRDDGQGFEVAESRAGHGLQNMRTRAGRLGAMLDVQSAIGEGTVLTLLFKIPQSAG